MFVIRAIRSDGGLSWWAGSQFGAKCFCKYYSSKEEAIMILHRIERSLKMSSPLRKYHRFEVVEKKMTIEEAADTFHDHLKKKHGLYPYGSWWSVGVGANEIHVYHDNIEREVTEWEGFKVEYHNTGIPIIGG